MTPDTRQPGTGINIFIDDDPPLTGARIKVIGIGGGGSNAVNRMIEAGIEGIEFLVANTDLQALKRSRAPIKIQLGSRLTKGLGAGADPGVGREAALEDTDKIIEVLEGADMVFVTTGLGGGTGTGAAPIVASLATELDALTVAVVTKPFQFEGRRRMQQADQGLRELRECVDTVITIPNERLLHTVDRGVSLSDRSLPRAVWPCERSTRLRYTDTVRRSRRSRCNSWDRCRSARGRSARSRRSDTQSGTPDPDNACTPRARARSERRWVSARRAW